MTDNLITCSSCGRRNNTELSPDACWSCGQPFTDEQKVAAKPVCNRIDAKPKGLSSEVLEAKLRRQRRRETGAIAGGIASLLIVLVPVIFIGRCAFSPPTSDQKSAETAQYNNSTSDICYKANVTLAKLQGEVSLGEWDQYAAQNVDDISPEQEREIRKSLGKEMGLAPSEVNGWKDIYKSRAEGAKRHKQDLDLQIQMAQEQVRLSC